MFKLTIITFLALTVAQVALSSEELNAFGKVSKDCIDETKVNEEEFKKFYLNGMKLEAATEPIKCHFKCMMEKLQHLKSGVLDVNAAVKTWSEIPEFKSEIDAIRSGYEACKSEKGKDDCDTAFKITLCLQKHDVGDSSK